MNPTHATVELSHEWGTRHLRSYLAERRCGCFAEFVNPTHATVELSHEWGTRRCSRLVAEGSVAGDGRVDGAGPGVDAAGEGLGLVEALLAQPHGDVEGAGSVVAEDDDVGVGVELLVGAGGDVAHGHEDGVGEVGGLELPGLADVEEDGGIGLGAEFSEGFGGYLGREHGLGYRFEWRGCQTVAGAWSRLLM